MPVDIFGWRGKILNVDLSNSRVTERDTMDYAERFLGGRGIPHGSTGKKSDLMWVLLTRIIV